MVCTACRAANRTDAAFCEDCGAQLRLACPACGAEVTPGKRFCGDCGAAVAPAPDEDGFAPPVASADDPSPAERKLVTALFCDLVGSSRYAERHGAEAFLALLNRFFQRALGEVARFGGRVDKFLGDGFLALFGAPVAYEDHPHRAVLAALAVHRRLAAEPVGPDGHRLEVRSGIDTGLVVLGAVGLGLEHDQTAVGDVPNVAARLQERARPGEILVSGTTARYVEGYVRLETLGATTVRGREGAVELYRILGPGPRRSPLDRVGGTALSDFVGRRRELRLLSELLSAAREGEGQVVGVMGEPGMGKSRLLHEFRATLAADVTHLEGRCVSYGGGTPYLPIADLVRAACGLAPGESPPDGAGTVREALAGLGIDPSSAAYLQELLGLPGDGAAAGLSPEAIRARTFAALRTLFVASSDRRPLVLAVEDLHWVDATSELFLTSLARNITGHRVMLLASFRPGYQPPWADLSRATQIALPALGPTDSLSVVRSVLRKDVSEHLGWSILARAEGNPFFLEELTRASMESGGLGESAGVPQTVQGVILARIDRLAEESRRVLQTAAVLGREFPLALLEAVWPGPGAAEPHLDDLERQEFLYADSAGGEPAYVFKHALTQDVAYESLLVARRRTLHEVAGRALEELYRGKLDDALDRLAHHWSRADHAERAVRYLGRLAAVSANRYAHEEAAGALSEAIRHADDLPGPAGARQRVELTLQLLHSMYFLGHMTASVRVLADLRPVVDGLGDPGLLSAYEFWNAHTCSHLGDGPCAARAARAALDAAETAGEPRQVGLAHYILCREGWWTGRFHEGVAHGEQAISLLREAGEDWWLGHCHFFMAHNLYNLGRFPEALDQAGHGGKIGERTGDPRLLSWAAWAAGQYEAERGETERAVALCLRAVELSPDAPNTAWALGALGFAHRERGELDEAIATLERGIELARGTSHPRIHARFTAWLGDAYLRRGDLGAAERLAAEALATGQAVGCLWVVGHSQRIHGRAASAAGRMEEAERWLSEALATYQAIDARFDVAVTRLDIADLAATRGRLDERRAQLELACGLLEDVDAPAYRRRALLALADVHTPTGRLATERGGNDVT